MKNNIKAAALVAGIVSIGAMAPSTGLAAPSAIMEVHVTRVRTLDNGSAHIQFTGVSCGTGGAYLGVPAAQADKFLTLATAALLSGRSVEIQFEKETSTNFCSLTRIALL